MPEPGYAPGWLRGVVAGVVEPVVGVVVDRSAAAGIKMNVAERLAEQDCACCEVAPAVRNDLLSHW